MNKKITDHIFDKTMHIASKSKQKEVRKMTKAVVKDLMADKNALLIGKVQSGKTSTFINIMGEALASGYDRIIILTGTKTDLNTQTLSRINSIFSDEKIFEDNSGELFKLIIKDSVNNISNPAVDTKHIYVSMKGATTKKIAGITNSVNTLIIDDESDFASHNVVSKKKKESGERSTTNGVLHDLVDVKGVSYLAVTATPESNVLIKTDNFNHPTNIHFIKPDKGYKGVQAFFSDLNSVKIINQDEADRLKSENPANFDTSLERAINYFVIYSASIKLGLINIEGVDKARLKFEKLNMIVNVDSSKFKHEWLHDRISQYLRMLFKNNNSLLMEKIKNENYIEQVISEIGYPDYHNADKLREEIGNAVSSITPNEFTVLIKNGDKANDEEITDERNNIIIGGHKLSRGLSIKNLVVSYFVTDPKVAAADTTLQRARWFGYRKLFDISKVFLTTSLFVKFSDMANVQKMMWDKVDNGEILNVESLREIYANYIQVAPTSSSKNESKKVDSGYSLLMSNFSKTGFMSAIHEQTFNFFDQLRNNNGFVRREKVFEEKVFPRDELINVMSTSSSPFIKEARNFLIDLDPSIDRVRVMMFVLNDGSYRYSDKKIADSTMKRLDDRYTGFGRDANNRTRISDKDYSLQKSIIDKNVADLQVHNIIPNGKKKSFYALYTWNEKAKYIEKN